ncbi:Kalirin [Taenia crassiceps]|uniref:Kalirin n=1 Tax=Taenia crassiceps TaxID=6207 RepID=A0ABR4Q1C9_9CEST
MSSSPEALLEYRQQPLLELFHSEENYVQQLQLVRDTYMTVVNTQTLSPPTPSLARSESCRSDYSMISNPSSPLPPPPPSLSSSPSPPPPTPPTELANRWRVVWGNWIQLTEWHSQFVEKLRSAVYEQPDNVPRLFLNSQSRLRSMYMKYCENYSKAVDLVAQFKAYFEDLRCFYYDKNDILSRLMQPIQRVTRYHLPMTEALKLTEQAGAPECGVWKAAVAVLKNVPNDVQLMLEAAQIVGFPGSVTNQGNLRLFGAMYVARTTRGDLQTARTVARQVLAKSSTHYSYSQDGAPLVVKRRAVASTTFIRLNSDQKNIECSQCRLLAKCCTAAQKSINLHFTECRVFLFDQCLIITEDSTSSSTNNSAPEATAVGNGFQANFGRVVFGSGSLVHRTGNTRFDLKPQRPQRLQTDDGNHMPLFAGGRSPAIRRTVHIRRHGSHLSSLESDLGSTWPKLGGSAPSDPFRQSSYKFLHAIKVNRMAFVPYWLSSNMEYPDSPEVKSRILQNAAVLKTSATNDTSTTDASSNVTPRHPLSESGELESTCKTTVSAGCCAPDRLWFAVADESPSSEVVFILDPGTEAARDAWLRELADIATMQAQLQLALQNPRRFHFVCGMRRQAKTLSSTDMTSLCTNWRSNQRNAFLSAHSSTTQLVDSGGDNNNAAVDGNADKIQGSIHFRGVSAPQVDWWKQVPENRSLERWTESEASPEHSHQVDFLTGVPHDTSVPNIVQTPDDVFLPDSASNQTPSEDSNHLQLPADGQRTHFRRRSLSQGDADPPSERSQLSRQLAIHINTPSPSSLSEQSSICAATTDITPSSGCTHKKGFSEILSSLQTSRSASTSQTSANPTQIRRRLFRWSIVDKTTMIESPKPSPVPPRLLSPQSAIPPPRPPPPRPPPPSPASTHLTEAINESSKSSLPFDPKTQQLLRHTHSTTAVNAEPTSQRKQSSSRMLSRLRSSFRISGGRGSTTATDNIKHGIPTTLTPTKMTTIRANHLPNTLTSSGI